MEECPVMRHMCNLETVKTYEGTDHIHIHALHALVIGERVTLRKGVASRRINGLAMCNASGCAVIQELYAF
jgi:glutaryl-CoA dehydrogenase